MFVPSPPRALRDHGVPSGGWPSARGRSLADALERERELTSQERLSWARFEGAVEPTLGDATADPFLLGAGITPPRLPLSSGRRATRRSLEEELRATTAGGGRTPSDAAQASAGADAFDRALLALSTELDPWDGGERAQLALCDYNDFRSVAGSFRRWRLLVSEEKRERREYKRAVRRYKAAVGHHRRDLMAKGWVGWEVSALPASLCSPALASLAGA
jgi:hypothetical protein